MPDSPGNRWRELPVLQGMLPIQRSRVWPDVLAGITLAALGVPEVLGYARIAGMPLVTGLYTMLLPMAAFVVLGSSRHLVVAADSATAAILAAALTGLAAAGSERYVRLAGLAALLAAGMLLLARLIGLSFLANFLSRTVLVGFLTGVGIGVAAGQLPDMLGVTAAGKQTLPRLLNLVGLGAANAAAAFSGTFVVNGSPTKAQMVDSAGGRSQLAQLAASAVVLIVLLLLTGPLAYLPTAALAAVVFLIAAGLINLTGMRRLLALRKEEFAVALLTTAAVVVLGVQDGIVLAVVASVVDHLRHSYSPLNSVLVKSPTGHWQPVPIEQGARTEDGIVVYRFGTSLYYANAARLLADVSALVGHGGQLRWLVFDCAAIGDIDYTASTVLATVVEHAQQRHVRFVFSSVLDPVRWQLDRYGISKALDPGAYYDTPGEALEAFRAADVSR